MTAIGRQLAARQWKGCLSKAGLDLASHTPRFTSHLKLLLHSGAHNSQASRDLLATRFKQAQKEAAKCRDFTSYKDNSHRLAWQGQASKLA